MFRGSAIERAFLHWAPMTPSFVIASDIGRVRRFLAVAENVNGWRRHGWVRSPKEASGFSTRRKAAEFARLYLGASDCEVIAEG